MKKSILLLIMAVLSISFSNAQIKSKPAIGLSLSDLSKDPSGESKAQPGIQMGGSLNVGNKIFFEPGVFYTAKSTEYITGSGTSTINNKAVIRGLRVPLGIGVNLLGDGTSLFDVHAGGGVSGFFVLSTGEDIDKDEVESPSWGTYLGVGVDVWKLFLDVSYEWSLTNLQKDITSIDLGKHRTLYVNVGLKLYIQKKRH